MTQKATGRQAAAAKVGAVTGTPAGKNSRQLRRERMIFWGVIGGITLVFLVLLGVSMLHNATPVQQAADNGAATQDAAAGQGDANVQGQITQLMTAIQSAKAELEKTPNDPRVLAALGDARYDLGNIYLFALQDEQQGRKWFAQAVDAYEKALAVDSKNPGVRTDMATAAFYGGLYDKAEAGYKRAIADNPGFAQAYYNYGIFLSHVRQDYQGAIANWEKVLSLKPDAETKQKVERMIGGLRVALSNNK